MARNEGGIMRLRNKKTGEIVSLEGELLFDNEVMLLKQYSSLAELNAEWEDYKETDKYWFINPEGEVTSMHEEYEDQEDTKATKEIGNYFSSREEAELAVRKLKAWKRLKDKGFRFDGWTIDDGLRISICTNTDSDGIYDEGRKETKKDLDLLFCTEEDD